MLTRCAQSHAQDCVLLPVSQLNYVPEWSSIRRVLLLQPTARTYRRHGTRCSGIAQEDATFPFAFADGSVLGVLAIASDTQMHTNQTFQSAVYVPEHQADSAAVVGFGWANCEAGIVTGEMETVERGPFPCACGFFLRDRPRNPRENVKPRLGYVFVRFLRDQEFREHVKPRLVLGRFFGQDRPHKHVKPRLGHVFGRFLARPTQESCEM